MKFATETATIGIRGTNIQLFIAPPDAAPPVKPGDVVVGVISGRVVFTNAAGQSIEVIPGQFATLSGVGLPTLSANPILLQNYIKSAGYSAYRFQRKL
ncbi:MAG: hypothetical protein HC848_10485 [Limnobacter sp.]|nr:hypothetical protein [Limnobacter sp.]